MFDPTDPLAWKHTSQRNRKYRLSQTQKKAPGTRPRARLNSEKT